MPAPADHTVMPATCPIGWPARDRHGHSRTNRPACRPGLQHVTLMAETTRHRRSDAVHRDGAGRGPDPAAGPGPGRDAAGRGSGADRRGGLRGAGGGTRGRAGAPRHHAGEHRPGRRAGQGPRLRHRPGRGRDQGHRHRGRAGYRGVPVAGAGLGPSGRPAGRLVLAGLRAVRDAHRGAAVRRRFGGRAGLPARPRRPRPAIGAAPGAARAAGPDHRAAAGQGPGRPARPAPLPPAPGCSPPCPGRHRGADLPARRTSARRARPPRAAAAAPGRGGARGGPGRVAGRPGRGARGWPATPGLPPTSPTAAHSAATGQARTPSPARRTQPSRATGRPPASSLPPAASAAAAFVGDLQAGVADGQVAQPAGQDLFSHLQPLLFGPPGQDAQ